MEQQGTYWGLSLSVLMIAGSVLFVSCRSSLELPEVPEFTDSNTGPYLMRIDHLELIDSLRRNDPVLDVVFTNLIRAADSLLNVTFKYVPDKIHLPPSGDPHDYMSLHRYSYYNPETGKYDIIKDGQTNPEFYDYDKPKLEKISFSVYALALAYYYTGNESYAKKASNEINNWFLNPATRMNPNMNFSNVRPGIHESEKPGSGIVGALDFIDVIEAAGLLYDSVHWTPERHYQLKEWFYEFYLWMRNHYGTDSYGGTNVATWMDVQRTVYLLFTEQEEKINSMSHIHPVSERLSSQIEHNGRQTYESRRAIPQHYVYFNLKAYMYLSLIRKNQFSRIGYDRDWPVLKNCALTDCQEGGLKAALDDIDHLIQNGKKEVALFSSDPDFNTCRYLEIFRPAAVAFDNIKYEEAAQSLMSEGCQNAGVLLVFPSFKNLQTAN